MSNAKPYDTLRPILSEISSIMVGIPGRSKGCLTCRRRKKKVRECSHASERTKRLSCLLYIKPSVIFKCHFARDVSTVGGHVKGTPAILSSSIALDRVSRSGNLLRKRNNYKIRYYARPLPRYHWLQPLLHSREIFHVIRGQPLTAPPSNPVMLQLMKRSLFPHSGNTGSRSKASRPAVSALGCCRHWTSQTLHQPYAYPSKLWPWLD